MKYDVFLNILQWVSILWYFAVYVVRSLGILMHIRRVNICRGPPLDSNSATNVYEGVTILRPMKGIEDSDLYECVRSTFLQAYPNVEILLCISDPKDPANAVAQRLIDEFPKADAEILIGPDYKYGINPKVNNLAKGYKRAKYDIIWALDSNVIMHPAALSRAVLKLGPKIKLVHHLPVAVAASGAGWGGILDETYMLTAHSTFYTGINAVGIAPCVTGKSNIYRKSELDKAANAKPGCGLEKFANYMAEDQMISEALWSSGGRTAMAPDAAVQPLGAHIGLKEFWRRRARWIRLRKYMVTSATLVEPFTDCFFHSIFLTIICRLGFASFILLCSVWMALDWLNYRILFLYTKRTPRPLLNWLASWLVREALAFPLWLWAMLGHRIWWRNRPYKIKRDLTAEPVE